MTYFNIYELFSKADNDFAGILCLLYGQTACYDELSTKTILKTLKIHHIPLTLFKKKLFTQYKTGLVCNYRTKEPQAYFRNDSFLYMNLPAREKIIYLKALSLRKISDKNNYIPIEYFPNLKPNYFLTILDDKIIFNLESTINH